MVLRCVSFVCVVAAVALGQCAAAVQEKEPGPTRSPRAGAGSRRRLSVDPDSLLPRLLSRDARERLAAFHSVGLDFIAERGPQDIRLFALNIDADSDIERVLIVKAILDTAAVVLKKDKDAWWELGRFMCCGPGSRPVDPFIELWQTVW